MTEPGYRALQFGHGAFDIAHGHRCVWNEAARVARGDCSELFIRRLCDGEPFGRLERVDAAHVLKAQDLRVDAGCTQHLHTPPDVGLIRAYAPGRAGPGPDHFAISRFLDPRKFRPAAQMIEKGLRLKVRVKVDDHQSRVVARGSPAMLS